jgi:hypothetical protein
MRVDAKRGGSDYGGEEEGDGTRMNEEPFFLFLLSFVSTCTRHQLHASDHVCGNEWISFHFKKLQAVCKVSWGVEDDPFPLSLLFSLFNSILRPGTSFQSHPLPLLLISPSPPSASECGGPCFPATLAGALRLTIQPPPLSPTPPPLSPHAPTP